MFDAFDAWFSLNSKAPDTTFTHMFTHTHTHTHTHRGRLETSYVTVLCMKNFRAIVDNSLMAYCVWPTGENSFTVIESKDACLRADVWLGEIRRHSFYLFVCIYFPVLSAGVPAGGAGLLSVCTLPFKSLGALRNVFIFQRKALFFQ